MRHRKVYRSPGSFLVSVAMKKCPVCGVSVKVENLEKHVRNQHPRAEIDASELLTETERESVDEAAVTRTAARPSLTKRGKLVIGIAAILLVVVLAVIIVNPFRAGLRPGQVAPDFSVVATDGSGVSLQGLRGKPVLLEFMDVDCPHCVNEAPVLVSLHSSHSTTVNFLSLDVNFIQPDDSVGKIDAFARNYRTNWTYALVDADLVSLYAITATPTIYILNASGVIVQVYTGETSFGTLSSALEQALRG